MKGIAVIDAETDPFRKGRVIIRPFLWGYYNGSEYHEFRDTADLVAFISERNEIIYAHNGGRFDFHFILDALEEYADIKIINGRIAQCWIGAAELRDSWCIVNEPLSKYKKDKIDYAIMEESERYKPKNWRAITTYLKSDCVYLWEMTSAFVKRFGPQLTQAGAAMKQWIKMSGETPEYTDKEFYERFTNRPCEEIPHAIGDYYYGGRVECFESGIIDKPFDVYDINSAYPYAMLQKHPYSANFERISGYEEHCDFYAVECVSRGAFPYRNYHPDSDDDFSGLHFPTDNVRRIYYVTCWEYSAAMDTKTIERAKVLESIRFMRHTDFSVFINPFWEERKAAKAKGDVLSGIFTKVMMCSLYGKWAANPDNYKNYMIVENNDTNKTKLLNATEPGTWTHGGELGPWLLAQRDLDSFQQRYYNVATGASITGFVRAYLWRGICSSKGALYCDTDAIACEKGGSFIKIGDELGNWKHEGRFSRAGIAGKKLYIFEGVDAAGARLVKKASKGAKLTEAELWTVAAGGTVDYEPDVPTFSAKKAPVLTNRHIRLTAKKSLQGKRKRVK